MGGKQVLVGDMPVGNLTAFTTYIVQVLMSLMMLAMVLLQSSRAIASAKRINEVLDTEIDLTDDRAGKKDALVQKGRIEFRGVSFRYYKESQEKVLDDINLTIHSCPANLSAVQGLPQILLHNQGTSGGIDDFHSILHFCNGIFIDNAFC